MAALMTAPNGRLRRRGSWTALAVASLALLPSIADAAALTTPAASSGTATMERRLKAAFLYKFSGYVEWPAASFPRPETPVVIGVVGDKRLATELAAMVTGRTTDGRPVAVVDVDPDDVPKRLHILFVAQSESARLRDWVASVQGSPVLVVSESERGLEEGSMINFVLESGRVRFEIAVPPAERSGLRLSSGLLAVAKSVQTTPP